MWYTRCKLGCVSRTVAGQCPFSRTVALQSLEQSVWTDDRVTGADRDLSTFVPLQPFAKTLAPGNILQQVTKVTSCWSYVWQTQHHTWFLLCITVMVPWWKCDIATVGVAFEPLSTRSRTRGRMQEGHCLCALRSVNTLGLNWCWPARSGVWLRHHGQPVATNSFHHRDRRLSGGCRVISTVFLFAWQVTADGDRSASAFRPGVSVYISTFVSGCFQKCWLIASVHCKVLAHVKWLGKQACAQAQAEVWIIQYCAKDRDMKDFGM